jgi:hypothetical protein
MRVERSSLPSNGTILADISKGAMDAAELDRTGPQRLRDTMY